jgi:DNA-binding MarR family transcriptional regulator
VDAGRLYKLARVLRELALDVTSDAAEGRPNAAETLVAADLFEHSPTTVSEIVTRTGVVQSQVSKIVADLYDAGVVTRERDPLDGRRTLLVVPGPARKAFGTDRGRRDIRAGLRAYLAEHGQPSNPDDAEQLIELFAELSRRLGVGTRSEGGKKTGDHSGKFAGT